MRWKLSNEKVREESLEFTIYFGKDGENYKEIIEQIIRGERKHGVPVFSINKRGNEKNRGCFLSLPVTEAVKNAKTDENKSLGVDLGINTPVYIAVNEGFQRKELGDRKEFFDVRKQMQCRKKRMQKNASYNRGGKGTDDLKRCYR